MSSFFLNPWLLAGLAAAVTPIVIEWLFRRRRRRVELPTIRFLLNNKEQKKVRRQDRILLLLRVAAIALLAFAIARPLLNRGLVGQNLQRNVILLLDGTASMNQQVDVTTSFRLAQQKAAAAVRALPEQARVSVVHLGDRVTAVAENEADRFTAAAQIEALRPGSGSAPMSAALAAVKDLLAGHKLDTAELYIFSDFQQQTWKRVSAAMETSRLLGELSRTCEIFEIDVGGQPQFNYVATSLEPAEFVLSAGLPTTFRAGIEAIGAVPDGSRATATFMVDGVKKDVREISPGTSRDVLEFSYRFPQAGEYLVEVAVDGDDHRVDNRRFFLCRVPEEVRVLVLDETADAAGENASESAYLTRAIRPPTHPGIEKLSHFHVKTIVPLKLAYENLSEYAVIVMTATRQLNPSIAAQLENYVADGGALWLFLGDAANLYDYNRMLYKDGEGLLPRRLETRTSVTTAVEADTVFPQYGETSHPGLKLFSRTAGDREAAILNYVTFSAEDAARSETVLQLSDGTPALVEGRYGARGGRVLLCSTTAGIGWNYLPALPEYPQLIQELLRYLVGRPDATVNLNVGEAFRQPVYVSTQHLLLRQPDGSKTRLTPQADPDHPDQFLVRFDETAQPGLYEIEAIEDVLPRRRFVVNPASDEADLSRLSPAEFADAFPNGGRWIGRETSVADLAANLNTITEIAPWIIAALAFLLAVESLLAWRFGRRRML